MEDGLHRVGLRLSTCFATGSASSFPICAGLADTTTLHPFVLLRFWTCYRPPEGFPSEVSPFALKGHLFPTFPCYAGIRLTVRRRTRCPVRFLQPVHCRSLTAESIRQVSATPSYFHIHGILMCYPVSPRELCCDGCGIAPLEIGVQPMQASPCVQGLRHFTLHTFAFSREAFMLLSPLPFGIRSASCPRRLFALNLLLLWSYLTSAEAAHAKIPSHAQTIFCMPHQQTL